MNFAQRYTLKQELSENIEQMETDLARWQGEVEDDKNFDEKLAHLKDKRQQLQEKLDALEDAAEDEWDEFKAQLDTAWKELKSAYDNLFEDHETDNQPSEELLKGKTSAMNQGGDQI